MDLKTIRDELSRLGSLVDGWHSAADVPAVERDLALELLRRLYERVRFAQDEAPRPAAAEPAAVEMPESIDLDEVLAIEPAVDVAEVLPSSEEEQVEAERLLDAGQPAPAGADDDAGAAGADEDDGNEAEAVMKAEEAEAPLPGSAEARAEAAEEAAAETAGVVSATVDDETGNLAAATPLCNAGEPSVGHPAEQTASAEESAGGAAAASAEESSGGERHGEEKPHPVMGSLFGTEEPVVRHRHRQRVIMSLYGDADSAVNERMAGAGTVRKPAAVPVGRRGTGLREEGSVGAAAAVERPENDAMPHPVETRESGEPESLAEGAPAESGLNPVAADPLHRQAAASEARLPEVSAGEEHEDPFVEVRLSESAEEEPRSAMPDESATSVEDEAVAAVPRSEPTGSAPQGGAVLGEVINHDVRTLADTIAPPHDMASEIARSEPVTDLRRAIGINDRFLMIRDLFGGDADAYEQAITALDGCGDLDECMIYIAENFAWNSNSDGARFLMELLERKYA